MNKRCMFFIVMQIISIIIEYLFLFVLLHYIFKISLLITLIIVGIIFVLFLSLTIASKILLSKDIQETKVDKPYEEILKPIIDQANETYHLDLKLFYLDSIQPGVAWSIDRNIYINVRYLVSADFMTGVVAHEVGHQISGICRYAYLDTAKFSTAVSKIFYLLFRVLYGASKITKFISYFFLVIYLITSLNNLIFTYPFLRQDEFIANSNAVKLGYGDSLRCYYGIPNQDERTKAERIADITHPSITLMANRVTKELRIPKKLEKFYYIKDKLIYVALDTYTLNIPDFIKIIKANSIRGNYKKITGLNVETVERNAFMYATDIEILRLPNCKVLPYFAVKKLEKLKEIKINDEKLLLDLAIAGENDNQPYVENTKNYLIKNNNIEAINHFTNEAK